MSAVPVLLDAQAAGEVLGISARAVMDLARSYAKGNPSGLRGVKVQRDWRFTHEDLALFIEANRTPTPGPVPVPRLPDTSERISVVGRARRGGRRS